MSASPTSNQARAVGFLQSGTGAIAENQQSRGRWTVLVTDYMSDAERVSLRAGSTVAADTAADAARTYLVTLGGGTIWFPAGSYSLNNWRYRTGIRIEGDGEEATIIYQAAAANPAIYCLADATTGQIHGAGMGGVHLVGHASASSPVFKVEAAAPYVVTDSNFEWAAGMLEGTSVGSVYNALEIVVGAANEVYGCSFRCNVSTSTDTAFKTAGIYNKYDFGAAYCSVRALLDTSLNSLFVRMASDGRQSYTGQNNTVLSPAVETIFGTGGEGAIEIVGNNHVVINPSVNNVDPSDCVASFYLANAGSTIISPRVFGASNPAYSFDMTAGPTKYTIIGGNIACTFKLNEHVSAATLTAGTFIGDCSSYLGGENPQVARFRYPVVPVGSVAYGSFGTSTTPTAGTIYLSEVRIENTKSLTGIGILNAATVGTNKHIVALFDSDGTLVANSALAGTTTSGADAFQNVPFTAAYVAVPGRYWIGLQMDGNTDRFRTIAASTFVDVLTKSSAGSFGTVPDQTVPTTFTADVGPIAYAY